MDRRALLLAGGACLAGGALYGWRAFSPLEAELVPRRGVAGFLTPRGRSFPVSGGAALSLGQERARAPFAGPDLRAALFPRQGRAHMAVFTDYRCPNCRQAAKATLALARDPDIAVSFHEWPLLGPASSQGARAALAAARQGRDAYLALHEKLMSSSFAPNASWLRASAGALGLDVERLIADMAGPGIDARLRRADALARRMGFVGTPSFVIGDVAVDGAPHKRLLRALVARAQMRG